MAFPTPRNATKALFRVHRIRRTNIRVCLTKGSPAPRTPRRAPHTIPHLVPLIILTGAKKGSNVGLFMFGVNIPEIEPEISTPPIFAPPIQRNAHFNIPLRKSGKNSESPVSEVRSPCRILPFPPSPQTFEMISVLRNFMFHPLINIK